MPTKTTAARNAACNAIVDLIDAGSGAGNMVFRTAANAEAATCQMSDPAFGAASSGIATASAITDDTSATGGSVTYATLQDSDAVEAYRVTVAVSGADVDISSVTLASSDTVSVAALTSNVPASPA